MSKLLPATTTQFELPDRDLDIFNKNFSRSMWNLVPDYFQEAIEKIPKNLLEMSEHELEKLLDPHVTTSRLRIAFWTEYERAQATLTQFRMSSVYSCVCTKQQFHNKILSDPEKLSWIICPPSDYIIAMKEVLMQGVKVLRKIVMAKNIVDEHGNLNSKNAEVVLKAIDMAHLRVYGAPVIRMESKAVNFNLNQSTPPPASEKSLEELQKEIREVEEKLKLQDKPILDISKGPRDGEH
jgi:hypothetical protein